MSNVTISRAQLRAQRKMVYLTALFGSIPMTFGKRLRRIIYPSLFRKFGHGVEIEPNVQFVRAQSIDLGASVSICSYTLLNCWDGGELSLDDLVRLDQGIHIQTLGATISIGARTYMGPYVCIAGPGNISIGKDCLIASHTGIYANNHIFVDPKTPINLQGLSSKGITIEDDCWLGSGVRVIDGVTIGKGSIIGAGAVVNKNIPPYSIAVGVPARVVGTRDAQTSKQEAITQTIA
ncbi:acyltransferase [Egbenema bharatensis]|uniref:acyltransferase n=1 Tax=Egbenema bharatensis TaxID=3463334 RepID=UPI003A85E280